MKKVIFRQAFFGAHLAAYSYALGAGALHSWRVPLGVAIVLVSALVLLWHPFDFPTPTNTGEPDGR